MKIIITTFALASLCVFAVAQGPSVNVSAACPAKSAAGKTVTLTIDIAVPSGYHIYAPGEKTGVATNIVCTGPSGYKFKVKYPASKTYEGLGGASQVFDGHVQIPVVVNIPKVAKGHISFKLAVTEQACNDNSCLVPATKTFSLSTSVK